MGKIKHDLLLFSQTEAYIEKSIPNSEIAFIDHLVTQCETLDNRCQYLEVINLNKYKIYRKPKDVKSVLINYKEKPFVFLNNKN